MDASQTPTPSSITFNRRSLLKGSASFAATAVAGVSLNLLNQPAVAENARPAATGHLHPLEDFPGGI
jgi:hypothetical protein